jgi:hypothetical protein
LACAAGSCFTAEAQLETRVSTPVLVGADPSSFTVADFNHDGKLDIAAVGLELQIFLGNGDGTFQSPISYTVGTSPGSVVAADFNSDGNLDLAVSNYLSATVSVLFGNGDGTFQLSSTINTAIGPVFIESGDFNGDKKLDLIILNSDYISVFLNNGNGTFRGPINTKLVGSALGIGDFDRDGTLDLAVTHSTDTSARLTILLGNGDGTFREGASYSIPTDPKSVAVADFRGDGLLDLAIADFSGAPGVTVLLGNGDGTFEGGVTYTSDFAIWATIGDFNGDGKPDLIVSNFSYNGYSTGSVSVLLGNGDGTFQPQLVFPADAESGFVAVGDFNGDHKLDVVDEDPLFGDLLTMLNTGSATFSPTSPLTFPTQLVGSTSGPLTATLTNSGTSALEIESVRCSAEPFKLVRNTCKGSLSPGTQCVVAANFTAQVEGPVNGTITFQDSASSKPQVVELVGTGTVVKLSPPQLKFPLQKVGTKSAPQTIQLTNTGSTALNFTHFIFISGKDYLAFSESDDCGSQIASGASCDITVTFSPHKKGIHTAFVQIEDDGGGSPQEPMLSGTAD